MARPSFKDIVKRDIKQTFLNLEEFGEEHDVNGETVVVIFDDIENVEREKKMQSHADGLHVRQYFLYIAADDFGALPAQGRIVSVDGKKYLVVDATDEAGVYGIIAGIVQAVPQIITAIINAFGTLAGDLGAVFSGAWEAVKAIFAPVGQFFSGVWQSIKDTFAPVGQFFTDLWNSVVNAWHTVIDPWVEIVRRLAALVHDEVIEPIKQYFTEAWNRIVEIFTPAAEFFSGIWNGIKNAFGAVTDWFSGVFTEAWTAVKNVFSTGGEIFVGIVDGILEGFKTVVNGIIGGINRVIKIPFDGINTALRSIRDVNILGVTPFSWLTEISVPQIPMLAEGGVVNQATILEAGEAGSEAIIPLGELWAQMQDMISDNIGGAVDRIADLLALLDGGNDGGDQSEPEGTGDGPMFHITYNPEYHFEGGAPSRDDLVEAERMSQDEFNRKMEQWQKDNARKRF